MNRVERLRVIRVKMVRVTMTLAVILSGRWLRRLILLGLTPPLMAAVSIGQGQAVAESAPQFTKMFISVKPEDDQPRMLVSSRTRYDRR
jgi:hypothetical protein